jgi:diketogulonate reductase-like aldo/keto reductase
MQQRALVQGDDLVPIPGTRNAEPLEENVGAADVTLSADDLRRIREAFPDGAYGTLRRGLAARLGVVRYQPRLSRLDDQ